ncbi:MAG: aldo/keto reductase [Aristaeellaceae bacterium]
MMRKLTAWLCGLMLALGLAAPGLAEGVPPVEAPGSGPADAAAIPAVMDVPMLTLNNGVQMPQFGLGTQIQSLESGDPGVLNRTSREAVRAALEAGYRHLDDAHGYLNERGVGQGIVDSGVPREEIWITDKLWPSEYADAYDAVDRMLERLGVSYLDLVYLHHPAGDIDTIVSAWQGLEQAYREGKIRALGISNFDNRMDAFNAIMAQEIRPQVMQIECHPFAQRLETRALAAQYGIQVECWYPLGHGDQRLLNADTLEAIAAAHGKSVVQVILRWHIQEGFSVIPGSTNPDHMRENIDIFDFALTEDEMARIRAMDQGEGGRYFSINYDFMGGWFTSPVREWDGEF